MSQSPEPRVRRLENDSWPGVSITSRPGTMCSIFLLAGILNVSFFRFSIGKYVAPICCVMPPALVPQDADPGHQSGGEAQGELVSKSTVPDNAPISLENEPFESTWQRPPARPAPIARSYVTSRGGGVTLVDW
eukprot:SAG22_NODE_790_length_7216_cov_5.198820_1_plen_133_part_00